MGGLLNPFTFHTIYDALNRVTNRNYSTPNGAPANYQATPNVVYTYDDKPYAKGLLTKISNGVSTTEYTEFDILGRVKAHKQTTDGQSYTTGYVYNFSGAMVEQVYPSGRVVKNVLDNDGQLSMVQSKKNANFGFWNYADSFTYTAAGAVSSMQLGNGKWESTRFNSRLQPTQIALGTVQNSTDKLKLNFTYNTPGLADNNGNVLSQTITVPTEVRNNITYNGFTANQAYIYDSLNRIEQATETVSGQTGNNWQQTFDYDRYGNRTFDELNTTTLPKNCVNGNQQAIVCANMVAQVNPSANTGNNRLNGYSFDNSGNTILDAQSRKFTYDGENKQVKVETVDGNGNPVNTTGLYFFDGDGKRVKKISATEVTIFVYNASGQLAAEYSTQLSQTPQVSYLTTDHLGSPRINTDANGNVIARHDLQPFGEEIQRPSHGTDDVRQKFTSYERDNETDLDYAQARMYANKLGRFTTTDPVGPDLTNPQTLNKYRYALNNPLRYVDKDGEYEEDVHRDLTNLLAFAAGFSSSQATKIANGNQGIDDNFGTGPIYGSIKTRKLYHFTTPARRREMWDQFEQEGKHGGSDTALQALGVFFHAQQDSFSHDGYEAWNGHAKDGHAPDKTYNDPEKAERMARNTFDAMVLARNIIAKRDGKMYKPISYNAIKGLISKWVRETDPKKKRELGEKIRNKIQNGRDIQKDKSTPTKTMKMKTRRVKSEEEEE